MKLSNLYMTLVMLLGVLLPSCKGDMEQPPVILPEGGIGSGAWNNPMSAYQASLGSVNDELSEAAGGLWVTGYIVGWIDIDIANVVKAETAVTTVPATVATNILMAGSPDEKDWTKMISVQLPSGKVRNALNLKDHPENLGVQVTVKGTTGSKYCSVYGVRSVSAYNFGPEGIDDGSGSNPGGETPAEAAPSLWCDFESGDNISDYTAKGWNNAVTAGGLSGWFIKNFQNNNYVTVNALKGTATGGPYEEWLVSPAIDLSKSPKKSLAFTCQSAYPAPDCYLEVYVLTGSNNPKQAAMTRLEANIPTPPESGYSSWTQSDIDLSGFSGVVYIGWRYYSKAGGSDASSTYCIDNVNIGGASEQNGDTPGGNDPQPSAGTVYEALAASSATGAEGWTFDNVNIPSSLSKIWEWKAYNNAYYLNASAYADSKANPSEAYAVSPAISLEGWQKAELTFEHAAKFQTTLRSLCGLVIREAGAKEWTALQIPVWPEAGSWSFVSAGSIDLSAFAGKKVEVAFKYASSDAGADTWEIRNLKVSGLKNN